MLPPSDFTTRCSLSLLRCDCRVNLHSGWPKADKAKLQPERHLKSELP